MEKGTGTFQNLGKFMIFSLFLHGIIISLLVFQGLFSKTEHSGHLRQSFNSGLFSVEYITNSIKEDQRIYNNEAISPVEQNRLVKLNQQVYQVAGLSEGRSLLVGNEPPRYPLLALNNGWQGETLLSFYINRSGALDLVRIKRSSGYKVLDEAALAAAANWQFKAGQRAVLVDFPVRFVVKP